MRLIYLAIVLGALTTGCAKKAPAAAAKTTPSNTDTGAAAPAGGTAPDATKSEGAGGGTRSPVNKGGDPCDGGQ